MIWTTFFPLANSWNIWNQTACNLVQFGACLSCKELPSLQMNYLYYGQTAKVNDIFFFFCLLLIIFNEKCPNFPEKQRYKLWSVHYGGCHAGQRLPMPNHDFTNLESCTRLNQVLEGSGVMLWKNCPGSNFYFKNPSKTDARSLNMEAFLFVCRFKTFQIFL